MTNTTLTPNDNVFPLHQPNLSLPDFNFAAFSALAAEIRSHYFKVDSSLYPHWTSESDGTAPAQGSITRIVARVDEAKTSLTSGIIALGAKLNSTSGITLLNTVLLKALEDLENAGSSQEQQEIQDKIDGFRQKGDEEVNDIVSALTTEADQLDELNGNIMFYEFGTTITDEQTEVNDQVAYLESRQVHYETLVAEAEEKRKTLADALEIMLLENNIFDMLGEIIPSAEDIQAIMELPPGKLQIVAAALDILHGIVGVIGDLFREQMFFDAQAHYAGLVNEATTELESVKRQLHEEKIKQTTITHIAAIAKKRESFCAAMQPLASAWQEIAKGMSESLESDEDYTQILQDAETGYDYVQQIIADI